MPATHAQLRARAERRKPLTGREIEGVCGMLRGHYYCIAERDGWVEVANRKGGRCVGVYPAWKFRLWDFDRWYLEEFGHALGDAA